MKSISSIYLLTCTTLFTVFSSVANATSTTMGDLINNNVDVASVSTTALALVGSAIGIAVMIAAARIMLENGARPFTPPTEMLEPGSHTMSVPAVGPVDPATGESLDKDGFDSDVHTVDDLPPPEKDKGKKDSWIMPPGMLVYSNRGDL